ncbi:MAG: GNAT family N-acetyltransferase [Oligoflexales bacterium]
MEKVQAMNLADEIIDFQKSMAFETEGLALDEACLASGVSSVIKDPVKGSYYLGYVDDEIAGSLLLIPEWSDWRNKTVLWVHSVYIKPAFRQKGVFRFMYQQLKEMVAKDPSYAGLRLFVDKRNHNAQEVYKALGMNKDHYELYEWLK